MSDLLKWKDEVSKKLVELEARVEYLEKICEKLMENQGNKKYEKIIEVMVENNLTELKVSNIACTVSNGKYICIEKVV